MSADGDEIVDAPNGSQIEGEFTIESAQRLAALLKSGPLPARLEPRGAG
jgi:preprotein translocase subunit SecD